MHLSYAELNNAYGRLINTIGVDPLPETVENVSTSELALMIENRFDELHEGTLQDYASIIKYVGKDISGDAGNVLGLNTALSAHAAYKPKFILTLKD